MDLCVDVDIDLHVEYLYTVINIIKIWALNLCYVSIIVSITGLFFSLFICFHSVQNIFLYKGHLFF